MTVSHAHDAAVMPRPRAARAPHKPTAKSDRDNMTIPSGYTCGECAHFETCRALIGAVEGDRTCDWSPYRFRLRSTGAH